jgi:hypothetical protein
MDSKALNAHYTFRIGTLKELKGLDILIAGV